MRPRRYTEAEWRKKGTSEAGAAVIEFALVATIFFILFFGIIDVTRMIFMYHHVGNAAREGSRYAIVHGSRSKLPSPSGASATDVQDHVRLITVLDPNNVTVNTTWPDGNNNPGSRVIVQVDYPFTFTLPIWFGSGITLESTSEMVISN